MPISPPTRSLRTVQTTTSTPRFAHCLAAVGPAGQSNGRVGDIQPAIGRRGFVPCSYCIWADAAWARAAGATEEEISEAVAIAATGRYWSTMLNGLQVDLATFKQEYGKILGAEQ